MDSFGFKRLARIAAVALFCAVFSSCQHPPLKDPKEALRPASAPELADDLPLDALAAAVTSQADFIEKSPGFQSFVFGEKSYTKLEYLGGLRHFAELARSLTDRDEFYKAVKRDFDFYEVYGDKSWGEVFITSYYEAVVPGSHKASAKFNRPLYRQPGDLISLDLKAFDQAKYALDRKLRGRLNGQKLVPYFTREEIDSHGALKNRKLELVWLDPVDAHNVQVQGSARILLDDGTSMRVGYADKNGQVYDSIGKYVRQFIPPEQLSFQAVEDYLHGLPPEKAQEYLNKDPSYVFFKEAKAPETSMGVPAVDGRTIATDPRFFPKGALGFLLSTKPKWSAGEYVPKDWQPMNRFVLDQDIGGAITGGGRVDLYWGSGDEAKRNAGVMKQTGTLFYLAPKKI